VKDWKKTNTNWLLSKCDSSLTFTLSELSRHHSMFGSHWRRQLVLVTLAD